MKSRKTLVLILLLAVLAYVLNNQYMNQGSIVSRGISPMDRVVTVDYWPAKLDQVYPEVEYTDVNGNKIKLSDYKGKVLIVEYIGMNCGACNAFAGAHDYGAFKGIKPQSDLKSVEAYMGDMSYGITIEDPRLHWFQVICYNLKNEEPSLEDIQIWDKHFRPNKNPNITVLLAPSEIIGSVTRDMIPGFHLIDKDFILRVDATAEKQVAMFSDIFPFLHTYMYDVESDKKI